jgi:ketosteroid isomerase-like protein
VSRTEAILRSERSKSESNKADIIRSVFAAYKSKSKKVVEDAFTADFRFTSPYDDEIDKAAYFERCWPTSVLIQEQTIERIFVEGDEAFVQYKVRMDGKDFRNTELFVFGGDKIKHISVYFGATYKNGSFVKQPMTES